MEVVRITRGKGVRNIYCKDYAECLEHAVKENWSDFNCNTCLQTSMQGSGGGDMEGSEVGGRRSEVGGRRSEIRSRRSEEGITLKVCKICGEEKDIKEFTKYKFSSDGHNALCKICKRKREHEYEKNKKVEGKIKEEKITGEKITKRPGHPGFYKLLEEMGRIHDMKNLDYGGGNPLGNFLEVKKLGIKPWKGALIRLTDKYSRVMSLASGKEPMVKDENIKDTLIDLANYAILTIILIDEK